MPGAHDPRHRRNGQAALGAGRARAGTEESAGARRANPQADGLQSSGVVARLEFDILKEGAVAAQSAGEAKTFQIGGFGWHWAFETWKE